MDPVINSLVQSPLVRSMSTVPSKASSFVHGVRDNVPPFSFQKVVVQPWNNPSKTSQDQSHKFRVPQFGTLNRAYLRVSMNNVVPTASSTQLASTTVYSAPFFDRNSTTAKVSGDDATYTPLKTAVRIPWVHDNQIVGSVCAGSTPLGTGGSAFVNSNSVVGLGGGVVSLAQNIEFAADMGIMDPLDKQGTVSNGWNVCNILDEIRLTTNGKLIETVYGETIPAEVSKMPADLREWYIKGMVGYKNGSVTGLRQDPPLYNGPWDPSACHRNAHGLLSSEDQLQAPQYQEALLENQHAAFLVPVTLSSLKSLSKNYQTRFVEDLEIEVKMKDIGRGFNEYASPGVDATKFHNVELVLIYHNWHDNIENTIRNSNYKRGIPASVYSTNWVRAASTARVVSDTLPLSIPLTSRNLVTELVVVARSKSLPSTVFPVESMKRRKSDYTIPLGEEFQYTLELTGSGKTIWSATNKELHGPDTADYDLTDRRMAGNDSAYGGRKGYKNGALIAGALQKGHKVVTANTHTSDCGRVTQQGVDFSFGDNMAIMRFGFQTTDEFYSGGIALQTISNPTIKITPPALLNHLWTDIELEFDVYVKHANLVRIDSDTGAVSRTLDV